MQTLTANATKDDLTEADYQDIFTELREGYTLRQFIELSGSRFSPARWSQWAKGTRPLSREMQSDLRRAVGLDTLPATVTEVAETHIDPDAIIARLGDDEKARRVLLIARSGPVDVHWNGNGPIEARSKQTQRPVRGVVTGVKSPQRRKRYYRPNLPVELGQRAKKAGLTSDDIRRAIEALINEREGA